MHAIQRSPSARHPSRSPGPARAPHNKYHDSGKQQVSSASLLLAAEGKGPVPSGLQRCVVLGGGFSGAGEEVGLVRVRTPPRARSAGRRHAMPCSIGPWGETGVLRLPLSETVASMDDNPLADRRQRAAKEEDANFREYRAEVERRLRLKLEEDEQKRYAENAGSLADLFGRLGSKYGRIQEEQRAARAREIALAQFEMEKLERRRQEHAATKIQSWLRGIWQRRRYRIMRNAFRKKMMQQQVHKLAVKRRHRAATYIQSVYRGWVVRMRYREIRRMKREDWLARRMRKHLLWLTMEASRKDELKKRQMKAARNRIQNIYSARAATRIQSWFRGWRARKAAWFARLMRMKQLDEEALQDATELERLRRIRREAEHANAELASHKDMSMVTHFLKRRDIEDHERLTSDLRKVREAAREVEAGLQEEAEISEVPLRELTDFLQLKQLREERNNVRREAEVRRLETRTMQQAYFEESLLQKKIDHHQYMIDSGKIRHAARKAARDLQEVQDGALVFSRLQDFRRDLSIQVDEKLLRDDR